jgi:hypothetical protein
MSKRHYALGGIVLLLIGVLVYKSDIIGIPDFLEDGYQLYINHWKWTVPTTVVVLWLVWSKFFSKKTIRPFATTGIGGLIESTFGGAVVAGTIGIVALGALLGIFIITGIADAVTGGKVQEQIDTAVAIVKNEPLPKRAYRGIECNFEEVLDARQNKIGPQWVPVTICVDDEDYLFFTQPGQTPEISYRNTNDQLLTSQPVTNFVGIESLWGKPGGMPNLYRLSVQKNHSGFDAIHLKSVELMIRGSSKTTKPVVHQQTTHALPSATTTHPANTILPCDKQWKNLQNCEKVHFKTNESHHRSNPSAGCPIADDIDKVSYKPVGDGYRYTAKKAGSTIYFFDLSPGETFNGFTC